MNKHIWTKAGALVLLLLSPITGLSKNDRPKAQSGRFTCGTSPEREMNALAKGLYYESKNRQRLLFAPSQPAYWADAGDVAVIEDDGSIFSQVNMFDLAAKSLRFEPAGSGTYRVMAATNVYDPSGGTPIPLGDDDSRSIPLAFTFAFDGTGYSSVQVNSDGNLTFVSPDPASTDRNLSRFTSGPPRIAPFFADLDPSSGGSISFRSDSDGMVFIWENVPEFDSANSNNFSVKLFMNGEIELDYGSRMDGKTAIVGISPGSNEGGVSAINYSSDLPTSSIAGSIVEVFASQEELSETALAKRFLQNHPDDFDHLIIFLAFDHDLGGAYAYELNVKQDVQGIGIGTVDHSLSYGSNARLRSFLMMGSLDGPGRYPEDPNQVYLGTNSTLGIMGQESGHRWLAFTRFQDGSAVSKAMLGRQDAHWSFFFDSDASVMEGNDIRDNGDGRFSTVGATTTYSRLDQYVIGLIGKEDVPAMFLVESPTGTLKSPGSAPQIGVSFGGIRKNISIDDIIAANGPRVPVVFQAPKVFRQAFILLTKRGQQATPEQIAKVQRIRNAWVSFFNQETGGRGWIVTDTQPTPGTTPASIYFPYFQGNSKRYTGIAVANWGSKPADVLFQAYDNAGNPAAVPSSIMNPRMITIPPGQQIAMLGEEIHGLSLNDPRNGWIEARSTSSQVSGFFLDGAVDSTLLDGAVAGNQTSTELYFTQASLGNGVFLGNTYKNLIDVINPNATAASAQFQLLDELGRVQATASRTLNARGRIAEDLSSLFSGITQPRRNGYVKLTSNAGVVGYQSLDGGSAVYALPAQRTSTPTKLYSAQFASGNAGSIQYFTDLNIINTSTGSRTIQVLLVGNDGMPVSGITNPATFTLAPGEQRRSRGEEVFGLPDAAFAAKLTEGTVAVTADGPGIIGDATFGDALNERFVASLPLDGNPVSNFVFSHVAEGSAGGTQPYFTGIAMYNPNNNDVSVTIDVFSQNGVKTGSATIPLARGSRTSKTLPQLIPELTNQVGGYIRISTAGGPIVAFELFGDQVLQFLAAVPPQPINP